MKRFDEFVTGIFVSTVIGLALSYCTILLSWVTDLSFLEAVAVYHFWIYFANWIKILGIKERQE